MKAKLIIDDQEIEVVLSEQDAKNLGYIPKKNGYERSDYNKTYFTEGCGYVQSYADWGKDIDEAYYKCANYYSDKTVAENNVRADNLMRQLRRFAVEHRVNELSWNNYDQRKFYIGYDCKRKVFDVECDTDYITSHTVYFDSYESAEDAISVFATELKWYFTEYKDSL